jgi:hypothetical protein
LILWRLHGILRNRLSFCEQLLEELYIYSWLLWSLDWPMLRTAIGSRFFLNFFLIEGFAKIFLKLSRRHHVRVDLNTFYINQNVTVELSWDQFRSCLARSRCWNSILRFREPDKIYLGWIISIDTFSMAFMRSGWLSL